MPIFLKGSERVFFAHIPRTGGSAVCLAFIRSGWEMRNVETSNRKGRLGHTLEREFGITDIPFEGSREGLSIVAQHAPYAVWKDWGPFTRSFAVCRDPFTRHLSAATYWYRDRLRLTTPRRFRASLCKTIQQSFETHGAIKPGFFRAQSDYMGPETEVFRFEDDWVGQIADSYGFQRDALVRHNAGGKRPVQLSGAERDMIETVYAEDFARFGYGSSFENSGLSQKTPRERPAPIAAPSS